MTTFKRSSGPISVGTVASIIFHAGLVLFVLHLVQPQMSLVTPHKKPVVIELEPPPPPPPPPPKPPVPIKPPPPPKEPPPVRTQPPPPQQIVTQSQTAPADLPSAPPAPPEPPAPPAPPAPAKVGTTVPAAYYNMLQGVIQNAVQYPPASVRAGEEGEAKIRVHFDRSGKILGVELVGRTGFVKLDNEARAVFQRIGKFPPIPANANLEDAEFVIELPINFELQ